MTELPPDDPRGDAARAAAAAMEDGVLPDVEVLAAVQDGLLSVPAGSPTSWFDVPSQRTRIRTSALAPRRRR